MNVIWGVLAWLLLVLVVVVLAKIPGSIKRHRSTSREERAAIRARARASFMEQRRAGKAARAHRREKAVGRRTALREIRGEAAVARMREIAANPQAGDSSLEVEFETRRPTVTRTAAGGLLGGPVGAVIGLAWRKKRKQTIRIPR